MEELNESIMNSETSLNEVEQKVEMTSTEEPKLDSATVADEMQTVESEQTVSDEKFEEPVVDYSAYTREALVEALKELLNDDIMKIKNRVASIRSTFTDLTKKYQAEQYEAFIAAGGNKEEYQPADDRVVDEYKKCVNKYRDRRQKHQEEQEAIKQRNLEKKQELLEELRRLLDSEDTLKKTYDDFSALQEKWKTIGEVPRGEANNLWQSYHFLIEKFFNKVKYEVYRVYALQRKRKNKLSAANPNMKRSSMPQQPKLTAVNQTQIKSCLHRENQTKRLSLSQACNNFIAQREIFFYCRTLIF